MVNVARIETLCKAQGLTFAALERKTDIANGSIRKWEVHNPSVHLIKRVADFFGVTVDELLK